jgi:hypothetical protein
MNGRGVLRAALCIALVLVVATTSARGASAATPPKPTYRLEDSPGWYPAVDPESMSVAIGRRTNAPIVGKPFRGGARSLEGLGRAVCRALNQRSGDSLLVLCITDDEFRDVLWREFPQSRPATGLTWEDGWISLSQRLIAGCSAAAHEHGGEQLEFVRFTADSVARYKNFKLYSRLTLYARDAQGRVQPMRWVRGIAERSGRFKIYSTDD